MLIFPIIALILFVIAIILHFTNNNFLALIFGTTSGAIAGATVLPIFMMYNAKRTALKII